MVSLSRVKSITPKVLTLGFLSLFLLTACQQSPVSSERFSSEKGVNVEAFMPADVFLLAKVGGRDAGQLSNLKQLNAYFPNDPMGAIVKEFNMGFKEGANLEEMGLDYERDILPILNEKTELYLAIAPGVSGNLETIKGVLAMTIADERKFDSLIEKQVQKNMLKKNGDYYTEVNQSDSPAFIARFKDVVFVSTDEDTLKSGLENLISGRNNLIGNAVYQRAIKEYKPSIAFIYGDFSKVVDFLSESGQDGQQLVQAVDTVGLGENGLKEVESEIIQVVAEKEGFRVSALILGKSGADLLKVSNVVEKAYLMDRVSSRSPVFYSEAFNPRKSYEQFISLAQQDGNDLAEGIGQMREFLEAQGLDLEKDVLSFMEKGFAVILENNGSVIPGVGLYLDASGNSQGAIKVAQKIHQGLTDTFEEAKREMPELALFMVQEEVDSGKLWKFKINLDALLMEAPPEIAKKLSGQKIEFYYGVLPDDVMVFALEPDLEKVYGKVDALSQSSEFKRAVTFLDGADKGVTFLAPAEVFNYLDRLLKLTQENGFSAVDLSDYELVKSYVAPLKGLISASKVAEKDRIETQLFLHIGP